MSLNFEVIESLQALDLKILEVSARRQTGPQQLAVSEKKLADAEKKFNLEVERLKKHQSEVLQKKAAFEDEVAQLKRKQEHSGEIKNQKEYQAHLREVEASRMELGILEQDLKLLSDRLSVEEQSKIEAESVYLKEKENVADVKTKVGKSTATADVDLAKLQEERKAIAAQIPADVFRQYDALRKRAKGKILFRIESPSCPQCFMAIAPQRFYELRSAPKIFACESCHALLYWCKE